MWSQSPRPTFPAPSLRPSSEGHQSMKSRLLAEQLLTGQKLVGAKGFDLAAKVVTCRQQFCTQRHSEPCSGPKSIRVASRWLTPCIQHDPYATHHIPSHNEWVSPHTAYLIRSACRNSSDTACSQCMEGYDGRISSAAPLSKHPAYPP